MLSLLLYAIYTARNLLANEGIPGGDMAGLLWQLVRHAATPHKGALATLRRFDRATPRPFPPLLPAGPLPLPPPPI